MHTELREIEGHVPWTGFDYGNRWHREEPVMDDPTIAPWAALLLLAVAYIVLLFYLYRRGRRLCMPKADYLKAHEGRLKSLRKELKRFLVDESAIEVSEEKCGGGSTGCVYRGIAVAQGDSGTQAVAVKLTLPIPSNSISLLEEAARLARLNHPNIVQLVAVSWPEGTLRPIIALQSLPGGSLQDYFKNQLRSVEEEKKRPAIFLRDILNILFQVSLALKCVHEKLDCAGREMVHGDIAARNVLLTRKDLKGVTVKLGDFGTPTSSGIRPVAWLPPEIVCAHHESPKLTAEGDIWMFGVFAWECLTLGATPHYQRTIAEIQKCFRLPDRGLSCPHSCPLDVWTVVLECLSEAHRRPRCAGVESDGSLVRRIRSLRDAHANSSHRVFVVPNVSACTCMAHRWTIFLKGVRANDDFEGSGLDSEPHVTDSGGQGLILPFSLPPISFNLPTFGPLPTWPPFQWPSLRTLPPIQWPTFPTLPPLQFPTFPTLPPLQWPTLPTLGPIEFPTFPTLAPIHWPTLPPFQWPTIPPPTERCLPKVLAAVKEDNSSTEKIDQFAQMSDMAGAVSFIEQQASLICSKEQAYSLSQWLVNNNNDWEEMSKTGMLFTVEERKKISQWLLNENAFQISMFAGQKILENLANQTATSQLLNASQVVSRLQFEYLLKPL